MVSGREVQTGIFKEPVEGPVAVGSLGLDGDVQADRRVHGGEDQAVYAYAIEDVEWWESELGRELGPGLLRREPHAARRGRERAAPGRPARPSGGVTLEATKPRQPCQKMATKAGDPKFVKRFAKAGRPGMYMRVVEPGEVAAGDP